MKKLIFIFALLNFAFIGKAQDKTGRIPTGFTGLDKAFVFTAADSVAGHGGSFIVESDSIVLLITNPQKYMQHQTFTTTLETHSGAPNVTITLRGKVTSTDSWHPIGTAVTWTSSSNNPGIITSTAPANYNYLKISYVSDGTAQCSRILTADLKTANAFDIPSSAGTVTIKRNTSGTVTLTAKDDDANAAFTVKAGGTGALTLGQSSGATAITGSAVNVNASLNIATNINTGTSSGALSLGGGSGTVAVNSSSWDISSAGAVTGLTGITIAGPINSAIAGGSNVISAGLLGGAGTATDASQTLGTAGGKAFSYYLSSTSNTATDVLTGYYMNVNYGTAGNAAGPSGDVIRGRAYLVGDAAGSTAITGGAFTVELAAVTASNTGLTVGLRGNLVLPSGVLTNAGTYYGTMAEIYLGGADVDTRAYTKIAPLAINVSGTAATAVAQLSNMVAMDINVPANMVSADGTMVVTGATGAVGAGLKIMINGTPYWIMLATADE